MKEEGNENEKTREEDREKTDNEEEEIKVERSSRNKMRRGRR